MNAPWTIGHRRFSPQPFDGGGGGGDADILALNPVLWLDASDLSTFSLRNVDGVDYVEEWRDKSGNENHAVQSSLVNQPIMENYNVYFNGVSNYIDLNYTYELYSVFFVLEVIHADFADGFIYTDKYASRSGILRTDDIQQLKTDNHDDWAYNGGGYRNSRLGNRSESEPYFYSIKSIFEGHRGGEITESTDNSWSIGVGYYKNRQPEWKVNELVLFDRKLSIADTDNLMTLLSQKHGITLT